jgi:4-oxalocrotonate tautomerase
MQHSITLASDGHDASRRSQARLKDKSQLSQSLACREVHIAGAPHSSEAAQEAIMPLIEVHLIENVFSPEQKRQVIQKLTDAMVSVEGENMRGVTWVKISEVASGEWGIGGQPLTTEAVKELAAGKRAA